MGLFSTRQRGFTLIEALVALLVLSIGMLGVAAMQLKSLQGAHAAYQRSIASLAAQDAQERLWAQLADDGSCPQWSEAKKKDGNVPSWDDAWGGYLPSFSASSSVSPPGSQANPDCEFSITVDWDDGRFDGEGFSGFSYSVRLPGE